MMALLVQERFKEETKREPGQIHVGKMLAVETLPDLTGT